MSSVAVNQSPLTKLWKFYGGVHPPFHKDDSNQTPITFAGLPDQLVLPLQQHIGLEAEPTVQIGDRVFKGQVIAIANNNGLSANIHAPTSGIINTIEERALPHISGLVGLCIVIDTDGKDDWNKSKLAPYTNYENTDSDKLLMRIQQAGIVGLGGATFPTAVKVSSIKPIKTLIINGAECEPYITCDDRLMRDEPEKIITGIRILQTLLKPDVCLIGIEDNKPEAIEALQRAIQDDDSINNINVVAIPTIYPSGGEKQLIEILTGQQVPSGGLPLDIGLMGLNIGTVYSIYKAVIEGEPLLSRIVTITGNGINKPQNFEVLIGTSFNYLAEQAGGYTKMADHLIMGGPMMGFALEDDQIPVVKATNCALITSTTVLSESNSEYADQPTLPCIRCGQCMDVCPVKLLPQQMYWHIRAKDFEKALDHNINDCIDCGACSYVCPSHIPLVDYFRFAKNEVRDQKIALEKSDLSRDRHEFLLFRKEREKRERDEKRAAHKAALQKKKAEAGKDGNTTKNTSKADAIKAAMARAKAKKEVREEVERVSTTEKEAKPKDEI